MGFFHLFICEIVREMGVGEGDGLESKIESKLLFFKFVEIERFFHGLQTSSHGFFTLFYFKEWIFFISFMLIFLLKCCHTPPIYDAASTASFSLFSSIFSST